MEFRLAPPVWGQWCGPRVLMGGTSVMLLHWTTFWSGHIQQVVWSSSYLLLLEWLVPLLFLEWWCTLLVPIWFSPSCYDSIGLHLLRSYVGLLFSFLLCSPLIEAHVQYDLVTHMLYNTILWLLRLSLCTIWSLACGEYSFLYDINLRATTTTILSIRGVTIPINLVSSATDSIRQSVVLFNLYQYEPQTLSLSSCVNRVSIAWNLQTPLNPPRTPGISPMPSQPRITHIAIVQALWQSISNRSSVTNEPSILVAASPLKSSWTFHSNITLLFIHL